MSDHRDEALELEAGREGYVPAVDRRRRIEEPLPVRLVAVMDVSGWMVAGMEKDMDGFWAGMLEFEKGEREDAIVYRAENFRLILAKAETRVEREDFRPIMVEVLSLATVQRMLVEREMEFLRQKSIAAGQESLLLQDPSGNWVEIIERREVR